MSLGLSHWGSLFIALAAWVSGLTCAFVALRHAKRMERWACPGADVLVERARKGAEDAPPESRDALARLELDLMRDEASRTLALATLVPRGMARIALATGTAFAVVALTRYAKEGVVSATIGAVAAFVGGACGSALAAWSGRRARDLASSARSDWKRALGTAARALEERP